VDFLRKAFLIIFAGEAAYLYVLLTTAPEQWFRVAGPLLMTLVAVVAAVAYSRGNIKSALAYLVYGSWATITLIAVINGGIKVPLSYGYPLVILVAGWLLTSRAAIAMAVLTSVSSLLLILAETQGWLRQTPTAPLMLFGVAQVVINVIAAMLIVYMIRAYQSRLLELQAISADYAKRTQDLEITRSELQQAQSVAKIGSWIYDLQSDVMRLSDETCRIFGLPVGTKGTVKTYLAITIEEDQDALNQAWALALKGGDFDHEHRIRVGDSVRWVRQKAQLQRNSDGRVDRVVGTTQDTTENKLAELSLRESERRFSTAFRSSPVVSSIATASEGRIQYANDNFERDFGWSQADLIGHTALEVGLWPDEASRIAFADAMRNQVRVVDYETVWLHKNGQRRNISISGEIIELDGQPCILAYTTDITQRKLAEEQIQSLAFYDPLTMLPNRRLLMDRLEQALAASTRHQRKAALLFIDLDNFKTLNDTHGHDKGDMLLRLVAERLSTCIRDGDTVARLGGDEFVVMLEDLNENPLDAANQAETVAEKILATLNQDYQLSGLLHLSTPSIGVTLFGGQQESIEEPLKRADLAMYQAKAAGRNTIRFFDPQMQAVVSARVGLEQGLREALAQEQFLLHFQPQIMHVVEGTPFGEGVDVVMGAEVLVRWQHPQRGMVSPAEFIPLAEETGLILPLGAWVLETACKQLALWAQQPARAHLTISVNVSARQFNQTDFVRQVLQTLERTGANRARLKLELTESLLVQNIDDVIAKMSALQEQGVGFSLGDFGTGYSSLAYLKRMPLDQLKIDQGFVRDILIDPNDAAIAKMVTVLAESLGLLVIAEGVETQAQKEALQAQECYAYQGYLFSKPLPIAAFETFLLAQ